MDGKHLEDLYEDHEFDEMRAEIARLREELSWAAAREGELVDALEAIAEEHQDNWTATRASRALSRYRALLEGRGEG